MGSCIKIETDALEKDCYSIEKKVNNLRVQLKKMYDSKSDEIGEWQESKEPPAPKDVYKEIMSSFLVQAESASKALINDYNDTVNGCKKLAFKMGEKLNDKYTLSDFWATLERVRSFWVEAESELIKIEEKRNKMRAKAEAKRKKKEARNRVNLKLQRRPSKDVLKRKGVYKSEKDIKIEKEKKNKIGQMALQNIIDRQANQEKKYNHISQGRVTRHKSLYLAQTRYKCAHCDIIIQDVANLNDDEQENIHCHQCYVTPYDKECGTMSLQWLPLNARSNKCQFKHTGPCLITYTAKSKNNQIDKKKKLLEQHKKFGTTDDLNSNSSYSNLKKMDFDDMMYGTGLVQGIDLINSLDQK